MRVVPAFLFAAMIAVAAAADAQSGGQTGTTSATGGAAQTTTTPPSKPPKTITLTGCVAPDETTPGQYTFADASDGTTYKLSGTDMGSYVGKRVQISGGSDRKKVAVRGGLLPSPNVAGQAGNVDPTQLAMSGKPPVVAGVGAAPLPEFRVRAVKPATGTCAPPQK